MKEKKTFIFVRLLAFAGLSLSAYLLWLKLSGQITSIVGCGDGSGCANVLGSQWSQFFYVPVSALSTAIYLVIFLLTFKSQRFVLISIAAVLVASAFWFVGVQVLQLHSFCPWCTAIHAVGVLCALAILSCYSPHPSGSLTDPLALGVVLVGVLILGQTFGPRPDTHLLTDEVAAADSAAEDGKLKVDKDPTIEDSEKNETSNEASNESNNPNPDKVDSESATESAVEQKSNQPETTSEAESSIPVHERGPGRIVEFGKKSFNVDSLPHIGNSNATHVLVEYFDYTCGSCRDMYGDLKTFRTTYGDNVAILMLPVPLNRQCNPNLTPKVEDHQHACELARLALAAWRVSPDEFPKVHDLLFSRPVLEPHVAQLKLEQIVPPDELQTALSDPWIDQVINANIVDFQNYTKQTIRMPKLLIRDTLIMHGLAKDSKSFVAILCKELKLPAN